MRSNWRERLQQALSGKGPDAGAHPTRQAGQGAGKPGQTRSLQNATLLLASIADNPRQPRQTLDPAALSELAASIAVHGVLQPILVRRSEKGYEVVAGHRRLRAAEMAGLKSIPAVVLDVSDEDTGLLALVENLQREELGYLEEAAAYERILREFGLTQEELARRLGRSQSTIANKLRLLRLPEEIRARIAGLPVTERHARALLSLKSPARQAQVVEAVAARALTVRQTEQLVERLRAEELAESSGRADRPAQVWRGVFRDVRILSNTFRAAVARLQQAGLEAEMQEAEVPEGLEIRVLIRLPKGWRDDRSGAEGYRRRSWRKGRDLPEAWRPNGARE